MNYVHPNKNPNKWIQSVLLDLLKQNSTESLASLEDGIQRLAASVDPGLIDDLFADWSVIYLKLLDELESSHGNDFQQCPPADPLE